MEIQHSSFAIFYVNRVLGLAPYLTRRNKKGRIDEIKLSILLCIYSVLVLTTAVILTARFLVLDANSKTPIRMKTATSKFVTSFDVCVVVGACACGAISGILGAKYTNEMNQKLREVDKELTLYSNEAKDKRRNIYMLIVVFFIMSGMILMDLISRLRMTNKIKASLELQNKEAGDINMGNYLPFYVLYFILMALQTQFAQTALGLARRYRQLNEALRSVFPSKKYLDARMERNAYKNHTVPMRSDRSHSPGSIAMGKKITPLATTEYRDEGNSITILGTTSIFPLSVSGRNTSLGISVTRLSYLLDRLAFTHATLGETVAIVSASFGLTLLAMLASCLLHLVATSYFLFLELLGENDIFVSSLQLLWCIFHTSRLLLIVEPCHTASVEAGNTILIVCEILRNCKDSAAEHILQKFWRQLLGDRTYIFSACGMCKIDRQILTSFSGAIATYLVILIQFQKTDG